MACNLELTCKFLFGYFLCTLPEDMIDIDITVHIMKGIHTFRKDQSMQISRCSLWGMGVKLLPSLRKKMKEYIKECLTIANPFNHRSYPCRPNPLPFTKWPKATPVKRSTVVTRHNIENCQKPRNINVGCIPHFFLQNWLVQVMEAEASSQTLTFAQPVALVVIPTHQTEASFIFTRPATVPATPIQPLVTLSNQTQKTPGYCVTCIPVGKQCPVEYPMPLKSDWLDSEEEGNDSKEQNEVKEEIEDWDGDLQK